MIQITSIKFQNYKSFRRYTVTLNKFNILVGPNNSGKSTIIGSLKILSEGIRKAKSRAPVLVKEFWDHDFWGYEIDLKNVPVATENIFHNYDDSEPAVITFYLSNKNYLKLLFCVPEICHMICDSSQVIVRTPTDFKRNFDLEIGYVPVLGPVEHKERKYLKEAARLALLSYTASRNFRNIWYHYPDNFNDFRNLVQETWPGMDILPPEEDYSQQHTTLYMFCPEERIPREIFWAGFGFQVWCQMLTYIIKNRKSSIFLIDEPDIYLHSDLQRQLIGILKSLGPDILIATHSTEMISEAEINEVLVINKNLRSAQRIRNISQLQDIFNILGSNLNPTLTQIAKTKKVLFVEGYDFSILSKIARKLGYEKVAIRSHFAVVQVEGFNPQRLYAFKQGVESTIGATIISGAIFDRDYRCDEEIREELIQLEQVNDFAHIHDSKELENYLLIPDAIQKAIYLKIQEVESRTGKKIVFSEMVYDLMDRITVELKNKIFSQLQAKQYDFLKKKNPSIDSSDITEQILNTFEQKWQNIKTRLTIIPGKDILSKFNEYLQTNYRINISVSEIINCLSKDMIAQDLQDLT